jgi:exodeoxyribonuclease V alpha subunit
MLNYSEEQQNAIDLCIDITKRIVCVTGQAGTGKTTILKGVYNALLERYTEEDIVLAAPTGRASKRIEEATGITASTIHKMLRYTKPIEEGDNGLPRHDKANPLPNKIVLIDEASMIDPTLWRGIIDALPKGGVIRFFGDINQLPPIANDAKSPFAEALVRFPSTILSHNYRSQDGIISLSDRVIKGSIPIANEQTQIFRIKSVETMTKIKSVCDSMDFTKLCNQIICPTQKTKYGCEAINNFIQQQYNPEKTKIQTFQKNTIDEVIVRTFKKNDKIIWTANNYDLTIMNGTLGTIKEFDEVEGSIVITIDGEDKVIPPQMESFNPYTNEKFRYDPRNALMLGYAVTTHKAQGSQFDAVLYVVSNSRANTRQNIYTAVTRAKNKLVIFDVANGLATGINNKTTI